MIKKRHTVQNSSDEAENDHAGAAYPAVEEEPNNPWSKPKFKLLLDADTAIVTCGLMNFETSGLSNGKSKKFTAQLTGGLDRGHLDKYREEKEAFLESFTTNFPELCQDRNIVVVDCTNFRNPEEDKTLRNHTGRHHETMKSVIDDQDFVDINKPLR